MKEIILEHNDKITKQDLKLDLEELKKLHPLVTDERFFKLSYFPNLELIND